MRRTGAREPARKNLAAFGNELPDEFDFFIVNHINLFIAELAHLAASEILLPTCRGGGVCRGARLGSAGFSLCVFLPIHKPISPLDLACFSGLRLGSMGRSRLLGRLP